MSHRLWHGLVPNQDPPAALHRLLLLLHVWAVMTVNLITLSATRSCLPHCRPLQVHPLMCGPSCWQHCSSAQQNSSDKSHTACDRSGLGMKSGSLTSPTDQATWWNYQCDPTDRLWGISGQKTVVILQYYC